MEDEMSSNPTPILLGRPFLKTARTKIDVHDGTLTMEFNGEIIRFNIFEAMRYPSDVHSIFNIDIIDSLVQKAYELDGEDKLEIVLSKHLDLGNEIVELALSDCVEEAIESLHLLPPKNARFDVSFIDLPLSNEKLLPSILQHQFWN